MSRTRRLYRLTAEERYRLQHAAQITAEGRAAKDIEADLKLALEGSAFPATLTGYVVRYIAWALARAGWRRNP